MPQAAPFLLYAGIAASAVGTGMSYVAQKKQAAQMDRINAVNQKIAQDKQDDFIRQRNEAAEKSVKSLEGKREKIRRMNAAQRQQYAMTGAQIGSGTPMEVMIDEMMNARLSLLSDKRAMADNIYNFGQATEQTRQQAYVNNLQAQAQIKATKAAATGTLLSGASSVALQSFNLFQSAPGAAGTTSTAATSVNSSNFGTTTIYSPGDLGFNVTPINFN